MTLWSGRTGGQRLAPEVSRFLRADDVELLPYDCEGTLLHARRLREAGILSDDELAEVETTLGGMSADDLTDEDEDVHSAIERLLGPVGRKIHAGRSRNDQVATAFRLYVADACREAIAAIERFARVVLDVAEREVETILPGYTHLQRAQPVYLSHHLLAYFWKFRRDLQRFNF